MTTSTTKDLADFRAGNADPEEWEDKLTRERRTAALMAEYGASYLRQIVPIMRELGVTAFADVQLAPKRAEPLAPMHRATKGEPDT
jgi:hypothetical protein